MAQTNLVKSNKIQTVRLAKDVAFPDSVTELTIIRDGPRRIIVPAGGQWDDFFDAPGIPIEEPEDPVAFTRTGAATRPRPPRR